MPDVIILPKGCMCGHDHLTHRDEHVYRCLECSCDEDTQRCQNCAGEVRLGQREVAVDGRHYDVCSSACAAQLRYALDLMKQEAA